MNIPDAVLFVVAILSFFFTLQLYHAPLLMRHYAIFGP